MHSCVMIQPYDDSPHLPTLLLSMIVVGYGCTRVPWSNPRMTPRISQHFCCLCLQWVMDALVCHDPTLGWLSASPNTSVVYDCSGLWMHSCAMIQPRMTPRISQHFCCLWLQWVMDALVCHDPTPGWLPASPNTSVVYDCSGLWMHSCAMIQPQDDSPHLPTLLLSMIVVGYGCTRV